MLVWLFTPLVVAALAASVPFTPVARGTSSGQGIVKQVTVRTQAEWQALWKYHSERGEKPPVVDFESKMVVGVFLGSKPSTGYEVEIVAVRTEDTGLIVDYAERTPGRGTVAAQIITEPFHLVAVPKHPGPVTFVRVEPAAR